MSKIKIVQANKFLYLKGGADKYCLTLIDKLPESEIEVIPFGMADKKNTISPWDKYFSENIDYKESINLWKISSRLIWNREAAHKFGQLLDETEPNIIHAHNIYHQISPSILIEAKKRKIPVIMTLHDYKLICPNYLMFTHGQHCEKCLKGNYLACIKNNCYYSYSRSGLAALESFLHNKVWHVYRDNIDLFISPSQYLKNKMISAGWAENKITVLNNPAPEYSPQKDGDRLLYLGRLSLEKGIDVLLHALKLTNEKLDIVGSGQEESKLKQLVAELNLESKVTFHGQLEGDSLEKLKKEAKAIILPSLWAENMSLVLLEALAYGKLIIASDSGGTPELIEDTKTGWLFPVGDYKILGQKINQLNDLSPEKRQEMAKYIKEKINPLSLDKHLGKLEKIYHSLNK